MPIERNNNPETDLIIGDNFPHDNEETFASDAAHHREISANLRTITGEITKVQQQLPEVLQGKTADIAAEKFADQQRRITEALTTHDNLAAGLEATAHNIAAAKSNLNNIDDTFRDNMDSLQSWGQENSQPQYVMADERQKLVDDSRQQAANTTTELSSVKTSIAGDLSAGRTIDTSRYTPTLRDGAATSNIIDNRGGFTPTTTSQRSGVNVSSGRGGAGTTGTSGVSRFAGSTSLSSTPGLLSPTTTPSGTNPTTGALPGRTPTTGTTQTTGTGGVAPMAGLPGVLGAANTGTAPTNTTGAHPTPTTTTGNGHHNTPLHRHTDIPENLNNWTDNEVNLMRVAMTIWQDLNNTGWTTGVATARVYDGHDVTILWTTDLGAAFIPETLTTSLARPIDPTDVDPATAKRLTLAGAAETMDLYLSATGLQAAERVVVASISGAPEEYKVLTPQQAHGLRGKVETSTTRIDGESLLPASAANGDLQEDINRLISRVEGHEPEKAVALAYLARRESRVVNPVMPDGSDRSPGAYAVEAVGGLLQRKVDEGSDVGVRNLVWQGEQFEQVA